MRSAMPRNSWAAGEMWLAMVRAPLDHEDGRDRMWLSGDQRAFQVRKGGSWLDGCWGARARPSMPWPGSAPGRRQKQPAFSGCFGLAVRGRGASVGHGYKNVKGQGTVTTPCRPPVLHAVRTGGGSVAISGMALLTAMTPSSWEDRQLGVVNVFLRIYQHRNGNHGPRVLLR